MNSKNIGPITVLENICKQDLGHATIDDTFAIDENSMLLHTIDRLVMAVYAALRFLVVGFRRTGHEFQPIIGKLVGRVIDRLRPDSDVLDAFAFVLA